MSIAKKAITAQQKSSPAIRDENWKYLQKSINLLFNNDKKQEGLKLDVLNEKVRNILKLEQPQLIMEHYKNFILQTGENESFRSSDLSAK